jgi:hypothetical protein
MVDRVIKILPYLAILFVAGIFFKPGEILGGFGILILVGVLLALLPGLLFSHYARSGSALSKNTFGWAGLAAGIFGSVAIRAIFLAKPSSAKVQLPGFPPAHAAFILVCYVLCGFLTVWRWGKKAFVMPFILSALAACVATSTVPPNERNGIAGMGVVFALMTVFAAVVVGTITAFLVRPDIPNQKPKTK